MKLILFLISIYIISIASAAIIAIKQHIYDTTPAEKEDSDKTLLGLEILILILACAVLAVFLGIALLSEIEDLQRATLITFGVISFIGGVLFCLKIEQMAGYYVCKKCGHTYVPKYKDVLIAANIGRSRYIKCQSCKQRAWHKKIATKPMS